MYNAPPPLGGGFLAAWAYKRWLAVLLSCSCNLNNNSPRTKCEEGVSVRPQTAFPRVEPLFLFSG